MAKNESVSGYLKSGKREVLPDMATDKECYVNISTPTGRYSMYEGEKTYQEIDNYVKREERRLANKMNYGDERGRAGVWRDNRTALDLALLKGRPDYLRVAYRAYLMSQNAPKDVQRYVYHNLVVRANVFHHDAEHFMLHDIQPYTFEVLPPAWRGCMNDPCPEFEGIGLAEILEPLTPAFKIGKKISRQMNNGKFVLCKVVGYEYNYRYSYRVSEVDVNPFALEYRVRNVDDDDKHPYIYNVKRDNAYPAFHAKEDCKVIPIRKKKK